MLFDTIIFFTQFQRTPAALKGLWGQASSATEGKFGTLPIFP